MSPDRPPPESARTNLQAGFRVGSWQVHPLQGVIEQAGHLVHIEPRVMDVLLCLARHPGQVVSREMLLDEVWSGVVVTDEVVTRCISELRTVLRDTGRDRQFIRTIPKRGYSLLAPVEPLANEAAADEPVPLADIGEATAETPDPDPPATAASMLSATARGTVRAGRQALATGRSLLRSALLGIGLLVIGIIGLAVLFSGDDGVDVTVVSDGNTGQPAATAAPPAAASVATRADSFHSLAVLPLVNLSGNPEHEYFSEGLAEDIRNTLISATDLRIAARTSSMAFRNKPMDVREIARQLNVDALLEGTVRITDQQLRVTTQLTDGRTGYPVWAASFERPVTDKLSLQAEIAEAIIRQVAPTTTTTGSLVTNATASEQALDDYLLGRHYWNQRTEGSVQRSIGYFEQALARDPNYALAYSGLADAWSLLGQYNDHPPAATGPKARLNAAKAVALNPDLAEAQASLGMVLQESGDLKGALAAYQKAVALQPGYSMAQMWLGALWLGIGDANEAAKHLEAALELDPLHPSVQVNYISSLIARGQLDRAREEAQRLLTLTPNDRLQKMLWKASLEQGNYDEVLKLATGQTTDAALIPYVNDTIIEALIYLQRYAEARRMIDDNREVLDSTRRLLLESDLAIARRDAPALRQVAEKMRLSASGDDLPAAHRQCAGLWADYRVAIADLIDRHHPAATRGFQRVAKNFDPAVCSDETPSLRLMATAYALESQARDNNPAAVAAAVPAARQIIASLRSQGWNDSWFGTGELAVALISGDESGATAQLREMRRRGLLPYGRLRTSPLFDRLWELPPLKAATPQMATDFAGVQQRAAGLKLAKFGL